MKKIKNKFTQDTFKLFSSLILLLAITSCGVNSNIMFKTPKGGEYKYDSIPMQPLEDYKISKDDKISIYISTNYARNIVNQMSGIESANSDQQQTINYLDLDYVVEKTGKVNLPIVGSILIENLTIKQLEDTLATLYNQIGGYKNPFVKVKVTNQRVIVFPGDGGDAKVIPLVNNNTTLMEALAFSGGISDRGKANSIKLMRMENSKRVTYLIDLSTIEGLTKADLIVQAGDYIYVEPNPRLGREVLTQISPFVSFLASIVILISVFNK